MLGNLTPRRALLLALLAMLAILLFRSVGQIPDLTAARLNNPDSYYKLVLLRDYTPQAGYQAMARDNAPYGSYLHWSMVHSWAVLHLAHGLMFMGVSQNQALLWAGGGLTLISMLLLACFLALTVVNQGGRLAAIVAILVLTSSRSLLAYGQLIQITHHIFMLVPLAGAACCFLWSVPQGAIATASRISIAAPPREGIPYLSLTDMPTGPRAGGKHLADGLGGALLGLALWISPETMPFVAALLATRAAARLQYPASGALWPAAAGLILMLGWAWLVDPPPPTFSAWALDHISLAWLFLGLLLGGLLLLTDWLVMRRIALPQAILILVAAAGLAALGWLGLTPGALAGPSGLIPPELRSAWWDKIGELQPARSLADWLGLLGMPVLAGALLLTEAWRTRCLWMAVLALSALAYAVLAGLHIRMAPAAALAAALAYGIALCRIAPFSAPRIAPGSLRAQWRIALLVLAPALLGGTSSALAIWVEQARAPYDQAPCQVADIADRLDALPAGIVLAPLNQGPEILWRTQQRTLSGNYHHNVQGLLDHFRVWGSVSPDTQARQILQARGVRYVLACSAHTDTAAGALAQPGADATLAARVAAGQAIDWLAHHETVRGWQLYAIQAAPAVHGDDTGPDASHEPSAPLHTPSPPAP